MEKILCFPYYTPQTVAERLGITTKTLDRWHARGDSPPRFRVGRKVYYDAAKFTDWLEEKARLAA